MIIADPDFGTPIKDESVTSGASAEEAIYLRSANQLQSVVRIPGTAREAEEIKPHIARIAKVAPKLFTDKAATERCFKELTRPQILVLSTHGFVLAKEQTEPWKRLAGQVFDHITISPADPNLGQQNNPLLKCGLLLAGCNKMTSDNLADDGVLTGLEIIGTDLSGTKLVVLSACETGLGEVRNGEGSCWATPNLSLSWSEFGRSYTLEDSG